MEIQPRMFLAIGALLGGLSVAAGAFSAHALKTILTTEMLTLFETATRYQMYHALALIAVGLSLQQRDSFAFRKSGVAFIAGIVLFSGSLYALAFTGVRWLGALTPLGGTAFLIGWGCLAWGWWRAIE